MKNIFTLLLVCSALVTSLHAQSIFGTELELPEGYTPQTILMPPSPLTLQVLFVGGHDLVQTTATYGNPAGQTIAKEWHDFIGFTPDETGESLGWVSVNHEMIYRDDRIGDGGGMTVFRVERDPITGLLNVVDQELADGRKGQFFNVDFVNTVGETGMNCGGISSVVDGRIWTAEEWFRSSNVSTNASSTRPGPIGSLPLLPADPRSTAERTVNRNQGVRDTLPYTISSDIAGFDGLEVEKYENFNWMVEIDPKEAVAIRKQYNWGRQGFEGGTVAPDNQTVYLGVDATPAPWVRFVADTPGDFTSGVTQVYKHDAAQKWITIDNGDPAKMLNFAAEAWAVGATMYNRIEWTAVDASTGLIYMTETGRDTPGSNWEDEVLDGGVYAPHHLARAADQGLSEPNEGDTYWDYYGRVLVYDPTTEEVSVQIEGGPFFETSPAEADYPSKHLSNPDGINVVTIDGQSFLLIQEDLNGTSFGRMPADISNRTCEVFLLNLATENTTVDDLIRLTAVPAGAEVTGGIMTSDGKSILLNSQHPLNLNPFPFNHSLTFALHGFDQITVNGLDAPDIPETEQFSIYPNPTTRLVYLNAMMDVAVYNASGQRVRVYRNVNQIDVSDLPAGSYFVQSESGAVQQLIIQ
ncbi:MAG: alkaline phosphatase PhoX [Bacteroidota bacterium]